MGIALLLLTTCNRVKDKVNSEKPFYLYFADQSGVLKDTCFDKVYGIGNTNLIPCAIGLQGIELPLNITTETSSFVFVKDTLEDTITLDYKKFYRLATTEYEVSYKIKNLPKNSFDSLSTQCIPQLTDLCNAYEGLYAIVYTKVKSRRK